MLKHLILPKVPQDILLFFKSATNYKARKLISVLQLSFKLKIRN